MFEDLKDAGFDLGLIETRPSTRGKSVIDWLCQLDESEFSNWWKPPTAQTRRLATYGLVNPDNDIADHPLLQTLNFIGELPQCNVSSVFKGEISWNSLRGTKLSAVLRRSRLAIGQLLLALPLSPFPGRNKRPLPNTYLATSGLCFNGNVIL